MIFLDLYRKGIEILIAGDLKKLKESTRILLNSKSKKTGLSLFHYYIIHSKDMDFQREELVDIFLKGGVNINEQSNKEHEFYSALHFAIDYPADFKLTKVLVGYGIDMNLKDEYGNTAFWNACHNFRGANEQIKIIEYLFDNGASTQKVNNVGLSVKDLIIQLGESIDEGLNPKEWDLRKLKINVS